MDTFLYRKSEETHLAPLTNLAKLAILAKFSGLNLKSGSHLQTLLHITPGYHCVVLSFSYWIVLKVLAAIQFRSRGEWRKLPYLAISPAIRHRQVQKDCQNRKREIGYLPLEDCPFLKTAYFQSLFSIWVWF